MAPRIYMEQPFASSFPTMRRVNASDPDAGQLFNLCGRDCSPARMPDDSAAGQNF
jgi:hypothetical protein